VNYYLCFGGINLKECPRLFMKENNLKEIGVLIIKAQLMSLSSYPASLMLIYDVKYCAFSVAFNETFLNLNYSKKME